MFTLTGTLKVKNEAKQINDTFRKREFVVTENSSQYPQHILFQLTQDKCELLDSYGVGDKLILSFFIRGREWVNRDGETKYFTSLDVWKIENADQGGNAAEEKDPFFQEESGAAETDDLPF